jgi:S-adenosylmethionine-diacylglycerol 3-amino-3-carboxypropyl transferase
LKQERKLVKQRPTLRDRLDQGVFDALYSRSLVYNACWEDPAVDRQALALGPGDTVLAITSAGCNVLDYALAGARCIHAVDANPRQTALLELKLAGIRRLEYADFFRVFGEGQHPHFVALYRERLRAELSPFARSYWDARTAWFSGRHGGFYFHSLAGVVARSFRAYLRLRPRLARPIHGLFEARSLAEQAELYEQRIRPELWGASVNWALSCQIVLSLLGVPHAQRREVEAQHAGGVAGFVREALEYLVRHLPFRSNYFYAVYVRGRYSPDCCPEYLKPEQFARLQAGLAARIVPHTNSVTGFLRHTEERISRFVLLDHMDWMSTHDPRALVEEWHAILARASVGARIIFRSAHARPRYLDWVEVGAARRRLRDALVFRDALAHELARADRVHTYAGFHIADVAA